MINAIKYEELESINLSDKKSIVISKCSAGGFTIAQKMTVDDGETKVSLFLKNAIKLDSLESLINLRDCLSKTIEKCEKS